MVALCQDWGEEVTDVRGMDQLEDAGEQVVNWGHGDEKRMATKIWCLTETLNVAGLIQLP